MNKYYFADPDQGCEFMYISKFLTEEQIKYIKENFDLEIEKLEGDEIDIIEFDYFCCCPYDVDIRDYLDNEGYKEIEDPNYTEGFKEIIKKVP